VLSVRPDGRVLLSAGSTANGIAIIILINLSGDDALIVLWNLDTSEILQEISCPYTGFVTAACWITTMRSETNAFAFGCADGSIHVYALDKGEVSHFMLLYVIWIYALCSPTVLFHSIGLVMDPSKTLRSNTHTADSHQWPKAPYRCGL
jgi:hypothetical protein